jgi:hypothetical protein
MVEVILIPEARMILTPEARMIRIAVTAEAYEAIARTLPLGSVGYEAERSDTGKVFIWLERQAMNRLTAERHRGEDLSDAIIRLAAVGTSLSGS